MTIKADVRGSHDARMCMAFMVFTLCNGHCDRYPDDRFGWPNPIWMLHCLKDLSLRGNRLRRGMCIYTIGGVCEWGIGAAFRLV